MKHTTKKTVDFLIWAGFFLLFFLFSLPDQFGPDYWYHINLGQLILKTGNIEPPTLFLIEQPSYRNIYWFFQLICTAFYKMGDVFWFRVPFILFWLSFFAMWLATTKAYQKGVWGFIVALGSLSIWQLRMDYRPETLTFAATMFFVWRLSRPTPVKIMSWPFWSLVLVQWVWTNSHGYFFIGIALLTLKTISAYMLEDKEEQKIYGRLLLACFLITFISPFHIINWTNVIYLSGFLQEMRNRIQEFMPATHPIYMRLLAVNIFWLFWVIVLLSSIYWGRSKWNFYVVSTAVLGLVLSAMNYRGMPFLMICSAPLWEKLLTTLHLWTKAWLNRHQEESKELVPKFVQLAAVVYLATIILNGSYSLARFSETRYGFDVSSNYYPKYFIEEFKKNNFNGPLFNNSSEGGFLSYHLPNLVAYGDSRFVDAEPVKEYFDSIHNYENFKKLHEKHKFQGVLLWTLENQVLIRGLYLSPEWKLARADLNHAFFVPTNLYPQWQNQSPVQDLFKNVDLTWGDNNPRSRQWVMLFSTTNSPEYLQAVNQQLHAHKANLKN